MKWMIPILMLVFLSACSSDDSAKNAGSASDGEQASSNNAIEHGITDKNDVGFSLENNKVEEAKNVPGKDKKALIAAFNEYMDAFNAEELDRYMKTIAEDPEGFEYDDEKKTVAQAFEQYDVTRSAENVMVIKYSKEEAQVYANLSVKLVQTSTGGELEQSGRQVTVFKKEDGDWRVSSVFFIGDAPEM